MTIIAHISDTHLIAPVTDDARAPGRLDNLRRCVTDINSLTPGPDVVIHTGDMSQHGHRDEYLMAREIVSDLKMPFLIAPGNRDSRAEMLDVFSGDGFLPADGKYIHYASTIASVRLVCVDTFHEEGQRLGDLCDQRIDAVDKTLGEAPDIPTAVFMHHPPFDIPTSQFPFQFIDRERVEKFIGVLQSHSQVERVFCGHAHRCYITNLGGIRASTVPSLTIDLRLGDYPDTMNDTPLYQVHRFHPETGFASETRLVA